MRITDLDQFALNHVMLPYQKMEMTIYSSMQGEPVIDIAVHAIVINQGTDWLQCVKRRILDMGFTFAPYVKHELVDIVKQWQKEAGQ